jgi:hypothetical protein
MIMARLGYVHHSIALQVCYLDALTICAQPRFAKYDLMTVLQEELQPALDRCFWLSQAILTRSILSCC